MNQNIKRLADACIDSDTRIYFATRALLNGEAAVTPNYFTVSALECVAYEQMPSQPMANHILKTVNMSTGRTTYSSTVTGRII